MEITLPIKISSNFKVPDTLKMTTAEENEFILLAGVHALESIHMDSAGRNDKTLTERLEEQHRKLDEQRKQQHVAEIDSLKKQIASVEATAKSTKTAAEQAHAAQEAELKKQLASAQATAEAAQAAQAATNASIAKAEADARKRAADEAAERIQRVERDNKRIMDELKAEREAANKEREKRLAAEREERKRTADELKTEHEKRLATEREMRERLTAQAAEAQKREDELRSALERAQGIKSCPALKGAANESVMTDVLTRAFGGDFLEKQLNAGDHLLHWEGFKLMIEDKTGYLDGVPKKEIDKAHDDFARHPDCDVLLFFSAESSIKGHTRPGDFDIAVWDSRPVLYVGKLNAKEDKVLYLQTLQPIIRELIKLTKKAAASGLDVAEALEGKLSTVRMLLKNHEVHVVAVRNSANTYARAQKSAWESHKAKIAEMEASFVLLLKEALTDDVAEESAEESAEEPVHASVPASAIASKSLKELQNEAKRLGIKSISSKKKVELIEMIAAKMISVA